VSSAPPLPEAFGNYALGDFVEVVSPQAISWLPQTTGWWWLGAVLLAVFAQYAWRRLRYWYRNRYRREATERLRQLGDTADQSTLVAELNRLLKLTALAAFSREQVASLSGEAWVNFLNRQCTTPPFSAQQGQLLALGTYTGQTVATENRQQMVDACITWVREHENTAHV
jgi:hypothetical protein